MIAYDRVLALSSGRVFALPQGGNAARQVYISPDDSSSREEFAALWKKLSHGVKTVPVTLE